jgi:hypothetical protein
MGFRISNKVNIFLFYKYFDKKKRFLFLFSYRVGYQSAYDLRVYDNAPIGVRHPNVICDACRKHGIIGMRWKCARCFDFDLCTHCYMALDKHDLTHPFLRFETATNTQVNIDKKLIKYFICFFFLKGRESSTSKSKS